MQERASVSSTAGFVQLMNRLLFTSRCLFCVKVPNSAPGRGNIEIEIYGMEGIPEADVKAHESRHGGGGDDDDEGGGGGKREKSNSPGLDTPPLQPVGMLFFQCGGSGMFIPDPGS